MRKRGFSLVEALVTMAVAGIIILIATQLFANSKEATLRGAAERTLEQVLLAQTTYASAFDGYATTAESFANVTTPRGVELTTNPSTDPNVVSVAPVTDGGVALAVNVEGDSCLGVIAENPYSSGVVREVVSFTGPCDASDVVDVELSN